MVEGNGWRPGSPGVVALPSGRLVRARSLSAPLPEGDLPDLGVYLLATPPGPLPWESSWIEWHDFRLPADRDHARRVLHDAWERSADVRVEVACRGGRGRTGTALACLAVLDGVPPSEAVAWVRGHHHPRAVETPWQRRYVARFEPA